MAPNSKYSSQSKPAALTSYERLWVRLLCSLMDKQNERTAHAVSWWWQREHSLPGESSDNVLVIVGDHLEWCSGKQVSSSNFPVNTFTVSPSVQRLVLPRTCMSHVCRTLVAVWLTPDLCICQVVVSCHSRVWSISRGVAWEAPPLPYTAGRHCMNGVVEYQRSEHPGGSLLFRTLSSLIPGPLRQCPLLVQF